MYIFNTHVFELSAVYYKISSVLDLGITTGATYESGSLEVSDDPPDCFSDRKTALTEGMTLYLPECTPDGRYQKVRIF